MKKAVVSDIIDKNLKLSLLIDKSTTISQISSLIMYIRFYIAYNENTEVKPQPVNIFMNLVELSDVNVKGIFNS